MRTPDATQRYPHPARLILILSLAPTVGLGIGRFAYALVLPDMAKALVQCRARSQAGWMIFALVGAAWSSLTVRADIFVPCV